MNSVQTGPSLLALVMLDFVTKPAVLCPGKQRAFYPTLQHNICVA